MKILKMLWNGIVLRILHWEDRNSINFGIDIETTVGDNIANGRFYKIYKGCYIYEKEDNKGKNIGCSNRAILKKGL